MNDTGAGMYFVAASPHELHFALAGADAAILTGNGYWRANTFTVVGGGTHGFGWDTQGSITSPSDGVNTLLNSAQTSYGRLQLGGTTSSFPSIKRNGAALNFRLADDSADALVTGNGYTIGTTGATPTAGVLNFGTGFGTINQINGPTDARFTINATQQLWTQCAANMLLIDSTAAASGTGLTLTFGNPGGVAGTSQSSIQTQWENASTNSTRMIFSTCNTAGGGTIAEGFRLDGAQLLTVQHGLSVNGTTLTAAGGALAQGFTTGGLVLPLCSAGAPSGAAANGNIVVGGDNNLWARINGAWVQVNGGGATPNLGAVVNAGSVVNGTAASGKFTFTTGGTYSAAVPEYGGPTDTGTFLVAGKPAGTGAGQPLALVSGAATTTGGGGLTSATGGAGAGTDQNGGGFTADSGASTGAGTAALLFKVPASAASGSGANSTSTVLTINQAGLVYLGLQNVTAVGAISLTASQGGSTSGAGGGFTAIGGAAGTAGGACGAVTITGGANAIASGSTAGGAVTITGGACSGTTSTGAGGNVLFAGGTGGTTSGAFGTVTVRGGSASTASRTGGNAVLQGGNGTDSGNAVEGGAVFTANAGASTNGGLASMVGGGASGGVVNQNGGGATISAGASSGTGNTTIRLQLSPSGASGASLNSVSNVCVISDAGCVYAGLQNATVVSAVSFTAGQGGTASGAGGNSSLIAGAAGTAGGACGTIVVTGGANAVASGSTAGGQVGITGGACSGTTSTGAGGALVFAGGAGGTASGTGGAASLKGGAGSGSTSGVGGLTTVAGGAGSTASSNNAGGGLLLTSGAPSGTGTADIHAQTGFTLASSATGQTLGDRLYIAGHSVTMSNTTATATTVVVLNVPTSNSGGGCQVIYQVVASDGTNFNTATGSFTVSCSNKAGVVTATTAAITDESSNANTGTLSAGSVTTTVASQAVSIKIAPAFTVIVPTSVITTVTVIPFGSAVTVTAQ